MKTTVVSITIYRSNGNFTTNNITHSHGDLEDPICLALHDFSIWEISVRKFFLKYSDYKMVPIPPNASVLLKGWQVANEIYKFDSSKFEFEWNADYSAFYPIKTVSLPLNYRHPQTFDEDW